LVYSELRRSHFLLKEKKTRIWKGGFGLCGWGNVDLVKVKVNERMGVEVDEKEQVDKKVKWIGWIG
jgi:hypothetical protein